MATRAARTDLSGVAWHLSTWRFLQGQNTVGSATDLSAVVVVRDSKALCSADAHLHSPWLRILHPPGEGSIDRGGMRSPSSLSSCRLYSQTDLAARSRPRRLAVRQRAAWESELVSGG